MTVDFRLISSACRDLHRLAAEGGFRRDFLYRIECIHIEIPPLKQRKDDIPPLVERIAAGRIEFAMDGIAELAAHDWPGNVRELRNVIEATRLLRRREIGRGHFGPTDPSASFCEFPPSR